MNNVKVSITNEKINVDVLSQCQPSREHGASNIFCGYVRNKNLGRDVCLVEYECHTKLCYKVFNEIAAEALKKWEPSANILIIHRNGPVLISELSVVVIATTAHRDESYKITRYIIEEIKQRAPIWKKEFYVDGETEWVKGHALCQHRKDDCLENSQHHTSGR